MLDIQSLQLSLLRSQTVAIAGKLKTLWRSLSIDDTGDDDSLFFQNLGDGGDNYIVETLINDVASLHEALSKFQQSITPVTISKTSLETESIPLKEHYDIALKADSLAILLNKSELFDYLTDPETQGLGGSLDLLFSLVHQVCQSADRLYCQSIKN